MASTTVPVGDLLVKAGDAEEGAKCFQCNVDAESFYCYRSNTKDPYIVCNICIDRGFWMYEQLGCVDNAGCSCLLCEKDAEHTFIRFNENPKDKRNHLNYCGRCSNKFQVVGRHADGRNQYCTMTSNFRPDRPSNDDSAIDSESDTDNSHKDHGGKKTETATQGNKDCDSESSSCNGSNSLSAATTLTSNTAYGKSSGYRRKPFFLTRASRGSQQQRGIQLDDSDDKEEESAENRGHHRSSKREEATLEVTRSDIENQIFVPKGRSPKNPERYKTLHYIGPAGVKPGKDWTSSKAVALWCFACNMIVPFKYNSNYKGVKQHYEQYHKVITKQNKVAKAKKNSEEENTKPLGKRKTRNSQKIVGGTAGKGDKNTLSNVEEHEVPTGMGKKVKDLEFKLKKKKMTTIR